MIHERVLNQTPIGVFDDLSALRHPSRVDRNSHVVAILPRGEAIRNFVYTGVFEEISRQAKVTLLSVVPTPDLENMMRSQCDEFVLLEEMRERILVRSIREVLDMAHGRWLWSKAAQERWLIHDREAHLNGGKWKRRLKKIACQPFANRTGLEVLSKIERFSSKAFRTTDDYIKLFTRLKPSIVFNGSHVHGQIAIQPIQAAQWLGIPTVAFIFSWDNLTSQGRIIPQYDYYLVWNDEIQNQLLEIYDFVRPEQVIVTGSPQFDFHFRHQFVWSKKEFCERLGCDPKRPIILYSTGMANHMPGEDVVVERIAGILRTMTDFGPPQLIVRIYPKDLSHRFDDVIHRNPDVLFPRIPWEPAWLTPKLEDSYLLTNMLRHVSAGINIASTVSLELCMMDKPVVNVAYNPPGLDISPIDFARYYTFDHYSPVAQSGAVSVASSEDELRTLVREALLNPQKHSSQRRALIERMFGLRLDGYSGTRVAHCLTNLAGARVTYTSER